MHPYATNFPWHPRLMMGITLVALAIASGLGWLSAQIEGLWGFPIGGLSAIAVFGIIYFAFDRFLWRLRLVRRFLLVPDLNGEWEVSGKTVMKSGESVEWPWEGTITVAQSWSKINVVLSTAQSKSASIAASLYRDPPSGHRLIYHYDNRPAADQHGLQRHCGLCDIVFDDGASKAQGQYFTDRDRVTVGTMALKRRGSSP